MTENNQCLKILCIGDSLSLPGHGNEFEDTWYCKLQEQFPSCFFGSFFKRGGTVQMLVSEGGGDATFPFGSDCLEFYLPNIIIIQLGIVDCAPRYIKKSSLFSKFIERLPNKFKSITYTIIKSLKQRSVKNADIPPEKFKNNLKTYLMRCSKNKVSKVIFIKICTPNNEIRSKSPYLIEAINSYNKIIENTCKNFNFVSIINPLNENHVDIYDDGYHPNPKGNNLVFEELKKEIQLV